MRVPSNVQLAKNLGVTEGAIRKAAKTGRIRPEADGSWNLARVKSAWAQNTDSAQQRGAAKQLGAMSEDGPTTFIQAKTANEVLKAQERRLRVAKIESSLVDREKAIAHVFQLARAEREAWANWPSRVSSLIAGELGVDPHTVHTCLEKYIRQHLAELSEVKPSIR